MTDFALPHSVEELRNYLRGELARWEQKAQEAESFLARQRLAVFERGYGIGAFCRAIERARGLLPIDGPAALNAQARRAGSPRLSPRRGGTDG